MSISNERSLFYNSYNFAVLNNDFFVSGGLGIVNAGRGVLRFDSTGRYMEEIAKEGRGPHELPYILFWYINEKLNKINVSGIGKMIVKSYENNETEDIAYKQGIGYEFIPFDDGSYVSVKATGLGNDNPSDPYLFFTDSDGELISSRSYGYNRDIGYRVIEGQGIVPPAEVYGLYPSYNGGAVFLDIFNDTVCYIRNKDDIQPDMLLKRGNLMPQVKDVNDADRRAKQVYFRDIAETEKYFLIKYFYNGRTHTDIWDKSSRRSVLHTDADKDLFPRMSRIEHIAKYKMPDGTEIMLNILYATKDKLYCLLEAYDMAGILQGVKEDDNPIVMVMSLK